MVICNLLQNLRLFQEVKKKKNKLFFYQSNNVALCQKFIPMATIGFLQIFSHTFLFVFIRYLWLALIEINDNKQQMLEILTSADLRIQYLHFLQPLVEVLIDVYIQVYILDTYAQVRDIQLKFQLRIAVVKPISESKISKKDRLRFPIQNLIKSTYTNKTSIYIKCTCTFYIQISSCSVKSFWRDSYL